MQFSSRWPSLPDACDLLVLAAHPVELAPLRSLWAGAPAGPCGGLRLGTAAVGVGMWASAAGTAAVLHGCSASAALLVGSYGYLPQRQGALLELLIPGDCLLLDRGVLRGEGALPDSVATRIELDQALSAGLWQVAPQALRGSLGTSLAITTSSAAARELAVAASDCRGENLEVLAVAQASGACGVPLAAVMVATNEVGEQGRSQWLAHHRTAAQHAAAVVQAYCEAGAPGLRCGSAAVSS